jgi:hypothetical protein
MRHNKFPREASFDRRIHMDLQAPSLIEPSGSGMTKTSSVFVHPPTRQLLSEALPSAPPFPTVTKPGQIFFRLSAFKNDKRLTPSASLEPQTYTTTKNDIKEVPSGLAAVGRYALPSPLPAVYLFRIAPTPGTEIAYGTVRPNYGMAGGGVEAYFPKGTTRNTVTYVKAIPMT